MKYDEFELTNEPDRYIPGYKGEASVIIYKGIRGTLLYWANRLGMGSSTLKYRMTLVEQGKVTFERALDPQKFSKAPNKYKGKESNKRPVIKQEPGILPSGISEVRSLL